LLTSVVVFAAIDSMLSVVSTVVVIELLVEVCAVVELFRISSDSVAFTSVYEKLSPDD
jgi:hypothetical protein